MKRLIKQLTTPKAGIIPDDMSKEDIIKHLKKWLSLDYAISIKHNGKYINTKEYIKILENEK
jgi:hypothetical protein